MSHEKIRVVVDKAKKVALSLNHEYVTVDHLAYAMLDDENVALMLITIGCDIDQITSDLYQHLQKQPAMATYPTSQYPIDSVMTTKVIIKATGQASNSGKNAVDLEDIVIAIAEEPQAQFAYLLKKQSITSFDLKNYISHGTGVFDPFLEQNPAEGPGILIGLPHVDVKTSTKTGEHAKTKVKKDVVQQSIDYIKQFCTNLNEKALDNKIDPLIGRVDEVSDVCKTLMRRSKNNVVLLGDAGTGKTAIVEGFAKRIVDKDVPESLLNTVVWQLDMGSLVAGTRHRGDFEERLKNIITILAKLSETQDPVLFIDEIHTLVGAGAASGSTADASNMLKPALARGTIKCIGASTEEEYKKTFGKDKALMRRFFELHINELDAESTKKVLRELRPYYETFHKVAYTDAALDAAVDLSIGHLTKTRLPDKALDLIDRTGAANKLLTSDTRLTVIGAEEIELEVSKIIGTKVGTVRINEQDQLRNLNTDLKSRIFGQDHVIDEIVDTVIMNRTNLGNKLKPIGSYILLGPTGTGKTEICKQIGDLLNMNFLRFDMSEYSEKHTVSRLIGAPPGYVGFDQGGLLTDAILKNSHSIILFDEIEKAHPDLFNILLQVLDYGKLTDHNGETVDFSNTLIFMSSNLGAAALEKAPLGFGNDERVQDDEDLKRFFPPEFRNRLDGILTFNRLSNKTVEKILDKFLNQLVLQLVDSNIELVIDNTTREFLKINGFDANFGARPLDRAIKQYIKRPLSKKLLDLDKNKKYRIEVSTHENEHKFNMVATDQE